MNIDKIIKILSVLLLSLFLVGCISGPIRSTYSIGSSKAPPNNYGVVFGKICEAPGFSVKNVKTGKEIKHISGYPKSSPIFAFQLPEGEYELYSIAAGGHPPMMSDIPYKFRVIPNKTLYVGSIIKSWSIYNTVPKRLNCDKEILRVVSIKKYGFSPYFYGIKLRARVNGDWPVYLANDVNDTIEGIKQRYPDFDFSHYETRLMY